MESKDKPRAMASGIQSAGEPRCFFANTVQDLSVLSAGLCILSRLLWQVVPAIRGIRQKHIDYRYELSGTYVHTLHAHIYTLTHTHTKISFPPTLLSYFSSYCLARQYSDMQAFQKSDKIPAQLNYFILHSVSVPGN